MSAKAAGNQELVSKITLFLEKERIYELLNIVLEQPVGLRPENILGRTKRSWQRGSRRVCALSCEPSNCILYRGEGERGAGHWGLGAQTLVWHGAEVAPCFLGSLLLLLAAAVPTGNERCAGSTVEVPSCLPAPLKTLFM